MTKNLLYILNLLIWCGALTAQTTVSYTADNIQLDELFKDFQSNYGLQFSYASDQIPAIAISGQCTKLSMDDALDFFLDNNGLEYRRVGDNVMIRREKLESLGDSQEYKKSIHIKGTVVDRETQLAMAFASISIQNTSVGTFSNEQGAFELAVPQEYNGATIVIHSLAYDDLTFSVKELKDQVQLIQLASSPISIAEIIIVNREKAIKVSASDNGLTLNKGQLNSVTSGLIGGDVSRQIQLLPGVNASDDTSSEIKIRGSNSDETLTILDGMPLYRISHYYGIFSAVNGYYLDKVTLYKNTLPMQYGGKTAGMLELLSTAKPTDSLSLQAELNLLSTNAVLSVPIAQSTSLSLAGRTTFGNVDNSGFNSFTQRPESNRGVQNFMDELLINQSDPDFQFYDINAKFQTAWRENNTLSLNFFSSQDQFANNFQSEIKGQGDKKIIQNNEESEGWENIAASLIWHQDLSKSLTLDSRTYATQFTNTAEGTFGVDRRGNNNGQNKKSLRYQQSNSVTDYGTTNYLSYHRSANTTLKLGAELVQHYIKYDFNENHNRQLNGDATPYEINPFLALDHRLLGKLNISAGLRANNYSLVSGTQWSPRLLLNYRASDQAAIKASASKNYQFIRELDFEYRGQPKTLWVNATEDKIPIIASSNLMVGTTLRLGDFMIDIEAYRKQMTGMMEYAVLDPRKLSNENQSRNYELFTGKGESLGIDMMLNYSGKNVDSYLAYTLSKTEHSFDAIARSTPYPTEDDRRHQLKWINEYRLGRLTLGANIVVSSGLVYTDLEAFTDEFDGDIRDIDPDKRFTRLPSYQRVDLSAQYRLELGRANAYLGLSLFNALDNDNVKYLQSVISFEPEAPGQKPINNVLGTQTNLLSRTLNISLRVEM